MLIEKQTKTFYNFKTNTVEECPMYRVSFKGLMVLEEDLSYAITKLIAWAIYKKLIIINK